MRIDIPERDGPGWASVAAVAVVSLGVGLAIAAWGTTSAEDTRAHDRGRARPEPSVDPGRDHAPDRRGGPPPARGRSAEPEVGAELGPARTVPAGEAARDPGPSPRSATPGPAGSAALRVRRIRVAYLRCDIGTATSVPVRACPRDEIAEAAIWAIVEGLMACPTPPTAAGSADLRLEYHADGAPDLAWRDTFAPQEARLDRERVLSCLREPLAATRGPAGSQRWIVSFRFRVE